MRRQIISLVMMLLLGGNLCAMFSQLTQFFYSSDSTTSLVMTMKVEHNLNYWRQEKHVIDYIGIIQRNICDELLHEQQRKLKVIIKKNFNLLGLDKSIWKENIKKITLNAWREEVQKKMIQTISVLDRQDNTLLFALLRGAFINEIMFILSRIKDIQLIELDVKLEQAIDKLSDSEITELIRLGEIDHNNVTIEQLDQDSFVVVEDNLNPLDRLLCYQNQVGNTLLHGAAELGSLDLFDFLLAVISFGQKEYFVSCLNDAAETAQDLLNQKREPKGLVRGFTVASDRREVPAERSSPRVFDAHREDEVEGPFYSCVSRFPIADEKK